MMNTLALLLSSRARAGLFQVLFGLDRARLHVRELARRTGLHEATIRQELRRLIQLDLVIRHRDGNRVYYHGNRRHPLFAEIHRLVLKTIGLADLLREALDGADLTTAFVFGSLARGEETAESDVDLMVIGEIGLRDLSRRLSPVADQIGREINPHVMTTTEYRRRTAAEDHFVTQVLRGPKLLVMGDMDEPGALGGQRLAEG